MRTYGDGMSRPILVLGATGKTGRRLVDQLSVRGVAIRAASRTSRVRFDWSAPETFDRALDGVRALYLVPPELVEDPSAQVAELLDRAHRAGVERAVLLSSLGVTFPGEPTDSGRLAVERAVRSSPLAWTILRPSGFMQNFTEGFLRAGVLRGAFAAATGDGAIAYVDAADIAAVAAHALLDDGHTGETYAITGGEALTNARAAAILGDIAGRPVAFHAISSAEMTELLRGFAIPPEYVAMLVRDMEAVRRGDGAVLADTVERITGRAPTSFRAFALANAAALRA